MLVFRLEALEGPIVPYVRMTQGGKWKPRAQRYLASQTALAIQFKQQMARNDWCRFGKQSLAVALRFSWLDRRQDLDNLEKGLLDAASTIVFLDDRWVDRCYKERARVRGAPQAVLMEVGRFDEWPWEGGGIL